MLGCIRVHMCACFSQADLSQRHAWMSDVGCARSLPRMIADGTKTLSFLFFSFLFFSLLFFAFLFFSFLFFSFLFFSFSFSFSVCSFVRSFFLSFFLFYLYVIIRENNIFIYIPVPMKIKTCFHA